MDDVRSTHAEDVPGTQGWKQFIASKQTILAEYRVAKIYSESHIVKVSHGRVAEAAVRKWLSGFLPQKYGVSSGYIISQGKKEDSKLPHFDVIIYDRLNSPTLWIEHNADNSREGASRAFPAEFVHGVIEVKSVLSPSTAKEALKKLQQLEPLLGFDDEGERYRKNLHQNFASCVIFMEMKDDKNQYLKSTLANLLPSEYLRGYFGGLVLEGEKVDIEKTGQIELRLHNQSLWGDDGKIHTNIGKTNQSIRLDGTVYAEAKYAHNLYAEIGCQWHRFRFASFGFELMHRMDGTYDVRFASTFHGFKL